jgi:hypothetical protein
MSISLNTRPLAALATAILLTGLIVTPARSQELDDSWDAATVTKLADELENILRDAYQFSLKAPPQETAFQQRERDAAQGVIRSSRDLSEDYARRIRAGWTRGESEPYFRRVAEEVDQIWETAGNAVPAESAAPLLERLQRTLDALSALYEVP